VPHDGVDLAFLDDRYTKVALGLHNSLLRELLMQRAIFVRDAIDSGRHTHDSLADLIEAACKKVDGYKETTVPDLVRMLRAGSIPPPSLQLITGGKTGDEPDRPTDDG